MSEIEANKIREIKQAVQDCIHQTKELDPWKQSEKVQAVRHYALAMQKLLTKKFPGILITRKANP